MFLSIILFFLFLSFPGCLPCHLPLTPLSSPLCCLSSHGLLHPPGLVPPPSSSSFNSPPPPQWAWPSRLFNISRQVVVILSRFVTFYSFNNPKNWRYPVANRPESSVAEDQKTSTSLFTQNKTKKPAILHEGLMKDEALLVCYQQKSWVLCILDAACC